MRSMLLDRIHAWRVAIAVVVAALLVGAPIAIAVVEGRDPDGQFGWQMFSAPHQDYRYEVTVDGEEVPVEAQGGWLGRHQHYGGGILARLCDRHVRADRVVRLVNGEVEEVRRCSGG